MKVAIVHYHLEPGGVTRVIENTLDSFTECFPTIQFVVLSGRPYPGQRIQNVQVVDGLDYSSPSNSICPKNLKEKMKKAAEIGLGGKPDLWHIHNHCLGKNPSLTQAVAHLAEDGNPILLQPHDFAEDGRPSNFNCLNQVYSKTYPSSPLIHYATLNHRDYTFVKKLLREKSSQVHILANSISIPPDDGNEKNTSPQLPENLFVYPVRAVRRKNLGELALIAACHPGKHFANSLGPTNPNFVKIFENWKEFSQKLDLPVSFAIGEKVNGSFQDIMNHAEGIISTSIAEGFGLGFLEPWMFEKFLYGRNIPEITQDFSNLGINLDNLYTRINIDTKHLSSREHLKPKINSVLIKYFSDYGEKLPKYATELAYQSIVQEAGIDFGRLDESFQQEIICSVQKSKTAQEYIQNQVNLETPDISLIQDNKKAVLKNFDQQTYAKKVKVIYDLLLNSTFEEITYAKGKDLLDSFLSPSRLNLLRTS